MNGLFGSLTLHGVDVSLGGANIDGRNCFHGGTDIACQTPTAFNAHKSLGPALMRRLVIVARDRPELCERLRAQFAQDPSTEVILDRRTDPSYRRVSGGSGVDFVSIRTRQRSERRTRDDIDSEVQAMGWSIVLIPGA